MIIVRQNLTPPKTTPKHPQFGIFANFWPKMAFLTVVDLIKISKDQVLGLFLPNEKRPQRFSFFPRKATPTPALLGVLSPLDWKILDGGNHTLCSSLARTKHTSELVFWEKEFSQRGKETDGKRNPATNIGI